MDSLVYHNDSIVEAKSEMLPPTAAGLIYGWGVFTTLRVYDSTAFAFDMHWERLVRHAERARVPITVDREQVLGAIEQLISANKTISGRARVTITKGEAGSWRAGSGREAELLIFTSSEQARARSDLAITISPYRLLSTGLLTGVKQTAMLEHLFALEEARSRGFQEGVLLNERGEIVSATSANIFWVQGDELFTPSLATGCVAGVTRRIVLAIARRMRLHTAEGSYPIQRLLEAGELFLTSSAMEIALATSFDMKVYDQKSARLAGHIIREFRKAVRSGNPPS
ncbi:MAG TPA: aminotransferase class IV [Blastocatellia bacterium]|jgi:branched-subunit amino acid aminotransferase/4-amino-4-deoxychorismate lyase